MAADRRARRLKSGATRGTIGASMRAGVSPSRNLAAVLSCAAFLAGSLAPCPPPARAEHAARAEHPAGCEMHEESDSVAPACPCGCGGRIPMGGSAARLGVALPSSAPGFEPTFVAARAPLSAPIPRDRFIRAIDHVPLPA